MASGANIIAGRDSRRGKATLRSVNPRTASEGPVAFHEATSQEIAEAATSAEVASEQLRHWSPARRSALLRACADSLENSAETIIESAEAETGLPGSPRLSGEMSRTTAQLRVFAEYVENGLDLDPIIDLGTDGRPDLRRTTIPIGPVGVFGASNFPLAFSVPGGDTASALAAGCPVVFKAHPSHPETSEACARALLSGIDAVEGPPGTFSLVHGSSNRVGEALVTAEPIKAIGFTGSHHGGRSLYDLAASRPEPIPVFAEMGSLNPVFVSPGSVKRGLDAIASGFVQSMTQGMGQFCTKPGLIVVPEGSRGRSLIEAIAAKLADQPAGPLLNSSIAKSFGEQFKARASIPGVEVVVMPEQSASLGFGTTPGLIETDEDTLHESGLLRSEHFGPVSVIVVAEPTRYVEVAKGLAGSLTASIHVTSEEISQFAPLQAELLTKAGRIIWNGYPTGVAVSSAMMHGGPYPATSNPLHTSVGATAVRRFKRPVAFQDAPDMALPEALQNSNPLGIWRLVNSQWTRQGFEMPVLEEKP